MTKLSPWVWCTTFLEHSLYTSTKHDRKWNRSGYVKLLNEEMSRWIETPDGVESRRRVNSNHQNVDDIFKTASLIQCRVTATFDVRFQSSKSVEVGVDGLIVVTGEALNSYKVGVSDLNVAGEANCVVVRWYIIIASHHLRITKQFTSLLTANRLAQRRRLTAFHAIIIIITIIIIIIIKQENNELRIVKD